MHRAYVHYLQGDWDLAEQNAKVVCTGMLKIDIACVAEAWYQLGELRRVRGDIHAAAEAFARARELGSDPQPGFALHLLALGRREEAQKSIKAALATLPPDQPERVKVLSALIDIALELRDVPSAITAAGEIAVIAARYASSGLIAISRQVQGKMLFVQGDASSALRVLREALHCWQSLGAPYEAAKCRVLIARAYRELGDGNAGERELDAALAVFTRLDALPDIHIIDQMRSRSPFPHHITEREAQVLVLVAAGKTNQEIGQDLFISPRTVARHLENIYAKLSISSRSAATSWCIEHGLRG